MSGESPYNVTPQRAAGTVIILRPFSSTATILAYYTTFLFALLLLWISYLFLPRGWKQLYCRTERKRYPRILYKNRTSGFVDKKNLELPQGSSSSQHVAGPPVLERSKRQVPFNNPIQHSTLRQDLQSQLPPLSETQRLSPHIQKRFMDSQFSVEQSSQGVLSDYSEYSKILEHELQLSQQENNSSSSSSVPPSANAESTFSSVMNQPSPYHPGIAQVPDVKIVQDTMHRLVQRGVRLTAHGVQSNPRRVWLRVVEQDDLTLVWQTEFPRQIINAAGETSLVWMRGPEHYLKASNVVYIDVGKKTAALLKAANADILGSTCLSLLTQNGSLDLQANSKLERDAVVSCLCMVLDKVHSQDWRAIYEESIGISEFSSSFSIRSELIKSTSKHKSKNATSAEI